MSEVEALDFIETIREGVLDRDLTVRIANRSYGDTFTVSPAAILRDKEARQ